MYFFRRLFNLEFKMFRIGRLKKNNEIRNSTMVEQMRFWKEYFHHIEVNSDGFILMESYMLLVGVYECFYLFVQFYEFYEFCQEKK